jgi:hypothetical protein
VGEEKEIRMGAPPNMEQQLGAAIAARNPYPKDRAQATAMAPPAIASRIASAANPLMRLMVGFDLEIEQEEYYPAGKWEFQGTAVPIAKAIRIPYNYTDENGNWVRAHILVGYEGSGSE